MTLEQAASLKVGDRVRWTGEDPEEGMVTTWIGPGLRIRWDSEDAKFEGHYWQCVTDQSGNEPSAGVWCLVSRVYTHPCN